MHKEELCTRKKNCRVQGTPTQESNLAKFLRLKNEKKVGVDRWPVMLPAALLAICQTR
jgi:hypothetical protein